MAKQLVQLPLIVEKFPIVLCLAQDMHETQNILSLHKRAWMRAGSELPVFSLHFEQGDVNAGIQLCREIRSPERRTSRAVDGDRPALNRLLEHLKEIPTPSEYHPANLQRQTFLPVKNILLKKR